MIILLILLLAVLVLLLVAGLIVIRLLTQYQDSFVKTTKSGTKFNNEALLSFLDEADDAYIASYQRSDITPFVPYCTTSVALAEMTRVVYRRVEFGQPKHRNRSWKVLYVEKDNIVVLKEIKFKSIRDRSAGIVVPYAPTVREEWTVGVSQFNYEVKLICPT